MSGRDTESSNKRPMTPEQVAQGINIMVKELKKEYKGLSIIISKLTLRNDHGQEGITKVKNVNTLLSKLKIPLIDHSNIDLKQLNGGKLHLKHQGNINMSKNIVGFLKTQVWNENIDVQLSDNMSESTINPNVSIGDKIIDLDNMHELKVKFRNNPLVSYLNINHLRNKIVDLRPIVQDLEPTVLAIAETKLNHTFPNAQFQIDGYYCPSEYRTDCVYNGGGGY